MAYDHLVTVVPAHVSKLGVRIVENVPVGLMFVGCTLERRCIEQYGVLVPPEYGGPQKRFICGTCGHVYETPHPVSDTLGKANYLDLDGQYWLSVWLGVDRRYIGVQQKK